MSQIWFERQNLEYFDEYYIYKGYALVNEIYEDEDHRANTWMWGKFDELCIVDAQLLAGLTSNSYAPWDEVKTKFEKMIDEMDKE